MFFSCGFLSVAYVVVVCFFFCVVLFFVFVCLFVSFCLFVLVLLHDALNFILLCYGLCLALLRDAEKKSLGIYVLYNIYIICCCCCFRLLTLSW